MKRERRIAAVTAALALGVPAAAAWWVHARTQALADHLGARAGVPATIGGIDANLTGTITLSDVALGSLMSADAIETSVALDALLAGHVAADEIRVAGPHLAIAIDRDGDSDLARLARRFASGGGHGTTTPARVRRVVVSSGTLVARIEGVGEVSADRVELVPDPFGARLITGKLRVRAGTGTVHGELELARSAAELALPSLGFGRVLAVGGTGALAIGDRQLALTDIAIGRLAPGGRLEARGLLDDAGARRALAAQLIPPAAAHPGFSLALAGTQIPLAPLAALAPRWLVLDGAHASGTLTLGRADRTLHVSSDAQLAGVRLSHPTIAPQPIAIDGAITASLALSPDAVALEHATIAIGAGHWIASGAWQRRIPLAAQLDLQLATAPCADLFASLPEALRGPLDGIAFAGAFGGRAHLAIDLAAPTGEGVQLDAALANACSVSAEPPGADVTALPVLAHAIELHKLPGHVPAAFVSAEDSRFFEHAGFDLFQIARSLEIDLRDHRLARGGSTISQQLVKNELLTQRRSLDRKIQEAILTWRLESRLTKKQILERYLDIIELGPDVHGVREAAAYWFDVAPKDLSIKQAAFLAALTSEPQTMSRRVRQAGGVDPESAARIETILRAMRRDGALNKQELDDARAKPLHFAPKPLRRDA